MRTGPGLDGAFPSGVPYRRSGLAPGTTMCDLAQDYADVIGHDIGGAVAPQRVSTGGSIALQVAVDHPHPVRRLVLLSAACRLSDAGRELRADVARLVLGGVLRGAAP